MCQIGDAKATLTQYLDNVIPVELVAGLQRITMLIHACLVNSSQSLMEISF